MKTLFVALTLFTAALTAKAQATLGIETIKDIVNNEQEYFNGILEIYKSDDPYIRTEDIALVYYGQTFRNGGKESTGGGKRLKEHYDAGNFKELYSAATAMLEDNPASLTALFYAWIAAGETGRSEEERYSYVNRFNGIVQMITTYGNGSSISPFLVVHPDDRRYVISALEMGEEISERFDTETLCSIHIVKPSGKPGTTAVYFDLSLFLKQKSKE